MIKKMNCIGIILTLVLVLSSCGMSYNKKYYFNKLIKNNKLEYLSYDNLDYFYHYSSGFEDKIGLNYYYFSFTDYANDFIEQFESGSNSFFFEASAGFENELMEKIDEYIGDKYNEIADNNKIDFGKSYIYSNFPMIYYTETNELIIIEFIYIR